MKQNTKIMGRNKKSYRPVDHALTSLECPNATKSELHAIRMPTKMKRASAKEHKNVYKNLTIKSIRATLVSLFKPSVGKVLFIDIRFL